MDINESIIAFYTLLRKEMIRIMRIWTQTLIPPVITTTLYFIIFGQLLGSQLRHVWGFSYIQFIVPGLVISNMLANAYSNAVSSFYGARFQRSIEEILVTPMPNWMILLGYIVPSVMRSVITATIVLIISLFFTHLPVYSFGLALLVSIIASVFFAVIGFINGMFAKSFDDVSWIPTFILTPLSYLGGIFYTLEMLPPLWQKISLLNPLMYIIDCFRFAILGVGNININLSLSALLIATATAFIAALYFLHKGLGIRN
jgi:ABC-2 type transport system permease protein